MTLPCSGEIGHSMIHNELYGVNPGPDSDVSLRAMSSDIALTIPDAESEFYCYETPPDIFISATSNNSTIYVSYDGGSTWNTRTNSSASAQAWAMQCSIGMENIMVSNYNGATASRPTASVNTGSSFAPMTSTTVTNQTAVAVPWEGSYWYYGGGASTVYRLPIGNTSTATGYSTSVAIRQLAASNGAYVFLTAGVSPSGIRRSTNTGQSWSTVSGTNINHMNDIACSSSGAYVFATKSAIFQRSTNYGSSFTQNSSTFTGEGLMGVSCDASGQYVLVISTTNAWVSTNYGSSFTKKTSLPAGISGGYPFGCRSVSHSGQFMLVPGANGGINLSNDYGTTFYAGYYPSTSNIISFSIEAGAEADAPVADFFGSPTTTTTTDAVQFTDLSSNLPTTWSWVFTPSTITYVTGSSTSQNPQVIFTAEGDYDVKLTVTNSSGNDSETKTDYISVVAYVPPPDADFHATNTTPDLDEVIQLIDDSTNSPTSWLWEVFLPAGGGYIWENTTDETSQNPYISFFGAGYYTIKLTATNSGGYDTATKTNYIYVGNNLMVDIVSYYKFTSGYSTDSHGNNDGTKVNPGVTITGVIGSAAYYGGTNSYDYFPCNIPVEPTCGIFEHNSFSISLWFKLKETLTQHNWVSFFSKWSDQSGYAGDWAITAGHGTIYANDGIQFTVSNYNGTGSYACVYELPSVSLNWNHLVVIKDAGTLKLYYNGELKSTEGCDSSMQFTNATPYMGAIEYYSGQGPNYFLKGSLDELGYWSRALTGSEVLLLYNGGAGYQYPFT